MGWCNWKGLVVHQKASHPISTIIILYYIILYYKNNQIKQLTRHDIKLPVTFIQLKMTQFQTFPQVLTYIYENILIPVNVQQTSYFPSGEKLRRIFLVYCGGEVWGERADGISMLDEREFGEFVLCCVLMKEGKVRSCGGIHKLINTLWDKQPKVGDNKQTECIHYPKPSPQRQAKDSITIHQCNLINLLSMLLKRDCSLVSGQNGNNPIIYDFVEMESDGVSLVVEEKGQ